MNFTVRNRLAQRYAEALKSFIKDEKDLIKVNKTYQLLTYLLKREPKLLTFLTNPVIPFELKKKVLNQILDITDSPEYFRNFANFLVKHNRVGIIREISKVFSDKIDPWLNRIEVEVTTATHLPEESEKSLIKTLERFTEKKVRLIKHINPGILGGIIIHFYGFSFDFSYRTQLEKLKEEIMKKEISIHVI
ncbi:MAG: ATP synthase F1 subunit delta [Candidatus Hydrogenedens sp.]